MHKLKWLLIYAALEMNGDKSAVNVCRNSEKLRFHRATVRHKFREGLPFPIFGQDFPSCCVHVSASTYSSGRVENAWSRDTAEPKSAGIMEMT